jgi:hypothetical protein
MMGYCSKIEQLMLEKTWLKKVYATQTSGGIHLFQLLLLVDGIGSTSATPNPSKNLENNEAPRR